ncbi:hypothetical protein I553_5344 [Mycobacterium xenopi 4042]|uniref:Short chain dehydrogenase family protein n=1 Tax=Mycobacterium xenopi 4042 TaxID=1299334 RepID=X7ZYU0_MYCXE|nr:hypothetical protein I553_5344 [Mycobacterium xenopi 4042]
MVVADINADAAEAAAKQIVADGGKAIHVPVDVSDPDSAKAMADATVTEFGGIDYLVNNAAIYGGMKLDLLLTVPLDYYKKFMSVNLDGALICTRAVYKQMAKRGGGAIVNQSSTAAWLYSNFYGLAKVGINGLTQQLSRELGGMNIRINAIAPGRSTRRPRKRSRPARSSKTWLSRFRCRAWGHPTIWSACACSCCRMRRRGSPVRSSTSTAGRSSGHDSTGEARLHRVGEHGARWPDVWSTGPAA